MMLPMNIIQKTNQVNLKTSKITDEKSLSQNFVRGFFVLLRFYFDDYFSSGMMGFT